MFVCLFFVLNFSQKARKAIPINEFKEGTNYLIKTKNAKYVSAEKSFITKKLFTFCDYEPNFTLTAPVVAQNFSDIDCTLSDPLKANRKYP